mmetsp:Transcript_22155/g.54525  ORF Transcript_22155/g.54525 Transcript_22155/m.54525 type:complete len:330 (-) Transcript_22155:180-1169(-)
MLGIYTKPSIRKIHTIQELCILFSTLFRILPSSHGGRELGPRCRRCVHFAPIRLGRRFRFVVSSRQDLLQLFERDGAAPIRIPLVEELVDLLFGHVEAQERHRLVELLARHLAVAVRIPLSEQVDDAASILPEGGRYLLCVRHARILVKVKPAHHVAGLLPLGLGRFLHLWRLWRLRRLLLRRLDPRSELGPLLLHLGELPLEACALLGQQLLKPRLRLRHPRVRVALRLSRRFQASRLRLCSRCTRGGQLRVRRIAILAHADPQHARTLLVRALLVLHRDARHLRLRLLREQTLDQPAVLALPNRRQLRHTPCLLLTPCLFPVAPPLR